MAVGPELAVSSNGPAAAAATAKNSDGPETTATTTAISTAAVDSTATKSEPLSNSSNTDEVSKAATLVRASERRIRVEHRPF